MLRMSSAGERCGGVGCEGAVEAEGDGRAGDEDDVGGVAADGDGEELVERSAFAGFAVGDGAVQLVDEFRQFALVLGHWIILRRVVRRF